MADWQLVGGPGRSTRTTVGFWRYVPVAPIPEPVPPPHPRTGPPVTADAAGPARGADMGALLPEGWGWMPADPSAVRAALDAGTPGAVGAPGIETLDAALALSSLREELHEVAPVQLPSGPSTRNPVSTEDGRSGGRS